MDAAARKLISGRKMIALTLEIKRSPEELGFRKDDRARLETTLMGDSTVEVSPGSGAALPAGRALLGDSGNLFTHELFVFGGLGHRPARRYQAGEHLLPAEEGYPLPARVGVVCLGGDKVPECQRQCG